MPRPAALALLLAALAVGCADAPGDVMDWQVRDAPAGAVPDTTGATARFAHFADGTVARAFERLRERPHTVTVTLADLDPDADDTLGVYRRELDVRPGAAPRVTASAASGTLADTSGLDPGRLLPADPFPTLVPGDAPFLDPRTRGAYRLDTEWMNIGQQWVLRVADDTADRPLVRSASVADLTGGRLVLGVQRASRSAIYDETSSATVEMRDTGTGRVPTRVSTSIRTATPGRQRHLVTTWAIAPAQDATMNRREP